MKDFTQECYRTPLQAATLMIPRLLKEIKQKDFKIRTYASHYPEAPAGINKTGWID